MSIGGGGAEAASGVGTVLSTVDRAGVAERSLRLRRLLRWCEVGADVGAWRVKRAAAGEGLDWAAEAVKTRAVVAGLMELGLVTPGMVADLRLRVPLPSGFTALGELRQEVTVLLQHFVDGFAVRSVPGVVDTRFGPRRLAAVRRLLPVVGGLVAEFIVLDAMDSYFTAAFVHRGLPILEAMAADAVSSDGVVDRAVCAADTSDAASAVLAARRGLMVARAAVLAARRDLRRNMDRAKKQRKLKVRQGVRGMVPATERGPDLFDGGPAEDPASSV